MCLSRKAGDTIFRTIYVELSRPTDSFVPHISKERPGSHAWVPYSGLFLPGRMGNIQLELSLNQG